MTVPRIPYSVSGYELDSVKNELNPILATIAQHETETEASITLLGEHTDNFTTYRFGTSVAANSHPDIVEGDIIQTRYHNDSMTSGSGGQFRYTGTTTAGKGGTWPNADGYFYDLDGKQFEAYGYVTVRTFGATGDGATDDKASLQAALNRNRVTLMQAGKYRTTGNLIVDPVTNRNTGFIGLTVPSLYPETSQTGGPTWSGDDECVIWYDGAGGSGSAVLAVSPEAVGTEPTSTFDNTVYGLTLYNLTLDGNGLAWYGFYSARLQQPDVYNVIARECEKDGFYINGTYSGIFEHITARLCGGRGISVGAAREDYGWTTNNKCNGTTFIDLWAYANGTDEGFDDVTAPNLGCGIYFSPHRSCHIYRVTSELNDGVGIVFCPTSSANTIQGIYTELNSTYDGGSGSAIADGRAAMQYGLRFEGITGGVSYGNRVIDGFLSAEELWIQGTEPSSGRPEGAPEFVNLTGGTGITASFDNYRLVNCSQEFYDGISGSSPSAGFYLPAGVLFDYAGTALSAYVQNNFTITLKGSTTAGTGWTYSVGVGSYTKIGRLVSFSGKVAVSAIGAGAAGNVILYDLPYPVANANNHQCSFSIGNVQNLTTAVVSVSCVPIINTTTAIFYIRTAAAVSETQMVITDISGTTSFHISGSYHTT